MDLPKSDEYTQEFEATIIFEGIELGGCCVYPTGEYLDGGRWVPKPVEWPVGLIGFIDLPEVIIEEPNLVEDVEDEPEERTAVERRECSLSDEMSRVTNSLPNRSPRNKNLGDQTESPERRG